MTDARDCPQCGTEREGDYRYCPRCGFDFAEERKGSVSWEEAARPQPQPAWVTERHRKGPKPAAMSTAEAFFGCIGLVAAGVIGFLLAGVVGAIVGFLLAGVVAGVIVVIRQAVR